MFAVGIIFSAKPSTVLATIKCLIVQVAYSVRNQLFLWVASTCYLVFKVVAKLKYLVAIIMT